MLFLRGLWVFWRQEGLLLTGHCREEAAAVLPGGFEELVSGDGRQAVKLTDCRVHEARYKSMLC